MFKPIVALLCLKLSFHGVEDDGTHVYLVTQPHGANQGEWMVTFSHTSDVSWVDGCYEMEGECDLGVKALDPPVPDDYASWGYPRLAPICNARRIEGKGFKWVESSK